MPTLRLATRGSKLAVAQSKLVAADVEAANPGVRVELTIITTTGDVVQDKPLHDIGGKGLFTKEVEIALLDGRADFAVHSFKDVPVTMPLVAEAEHALTIAAVPKRADVRDVLITHDPSLAPSARPASAGRVTIGTTSLRRKSLILERFPHADIRPLRGNIDSRLAKVKAGEFDAILLAKAGLDRLGVFDASFMAELDPALFVPAAGQGALALQCRTGDEATRAALAPLDDSDTRRCVQIERNLVAALDGDCTSPIGAWATHEAGVWRLHAFYETESGDRRRATATDEPAILAATAAELVHDSL